MGKLTLTNLLPGANYSVQINAQDGTDISPWSQLINVTTVSDTLSPSPVTSLAGVVNGTSYIVNWAAPTTNTDSTQLNDLDHYKINVSNGSISFNYTTPAVIFTYTIDQNRKDFTTLQSSLIFTVYAVDTTGNLSASTSTTVSLAAPGAVTGLTAVSLLDSIGVTYTAPVGGTTVDHYNIYLSTDGGTTWHLNYTGNSTNVTIADTNYVTTNVAVDTVNVFGAATRTIYGSTVTPRSSTAIDTTPPTPPDTVILVEATNNGDLSGSTRQITVSWTKITIETDLAGFLVQYRASGTTPWTYINIADNTIRSTVIAGLLPNTQYYVAVSAYDFNNNQSTYTHDGSNFPITTGVDSTAPNTPSAPVAVGTTTYDKIQVSCDGKDSGGTILARDMDFYEVYVDVSSTITPIKTGSTSNYLGNIEAAATPLGSSTPIPANGTFSYAPKRSSDSDTSTTITYWCAVIAVDVNGNRSALSATSSVSLGLITNLNVGFAVITDANIQNLTVTKLTAGTGLVNSFTVLSTLTLGASGTGGTIVSGDWVSLTSGFKLSSNGSSSSFEVNNGTISAKALALQNGENIMPPQYADFEFVPTFYTTGGGITADASVAVTIDAATFKYNSQALKLVNSSGATAGAYLGVSNVDYNIKITNPGAVYIVSAWVNSSSTVGPTCTIKYNDASTATAITSSTLVANTWTRIFGSVTVGSSLNSAVLRFTIPNGATVYIDGIQVEWQTGNLTTPSPWMPPSQTFINGGMITTGSIQSINSSSFGGLTQPIWSLNTAGGMTVNSLLVRGSAIIGDGSGTLTSQYIRSQNYDATHGWNIDAAGNAQFNNVTAIGTIQTAFGLIAGGGTKGIQLSSATQDSIYFYSGNTNETAQGFFIVAAPLTTSARLSIGAPIISHSTHNSEIDLLSTTTSSSINLTADATQVSGTLFVTGTIGSTGAVSFGSTAAVTGTLTGTTINATTDMQMSGHTLPRGSVLVYPNPSTVGPNNSGVTTAETVIYTTGSFTVLSGRRYRIFVRGAVNFASTSTTVFGTVRVRLNPVSTSFIQCIMVASSLNQSFCGFVDVLGGTDIPTGSQFLDVTLVSSSVSNGISVTWTTGQTSSNVLVHVEDIGV